MNVPSNMMIMIVITLKFGGKKWTKQSFKMEHVDSFVTRFYGPMSFKKIAFSLLERYVSLVLRLCFENSFLHCSIIYKCDL